MIESHEVVASNLDAKQQLELALAANVAALGLGEVTVSLTYDKQTATKHRIAGKDYKSLPGVSAKAHIGKLRVNRYVDNAANRRLNRVGKIYLHVESLTRATKESQTGHVAMRPEGIQAFTVLGVKALG